MEHTISVKRDNRTPSQVVIGDVIGSLDNYLPAGKRIIVITDPNVYEAYESLLDRYDCLMVGLGEPEKTLETVTRLYGELLALGADRSTFILGVGGGIVTDTAGFVASTYMRGMNFGFIATTLLAQVDASVGGKNGVNYEGFKNMVGTFNQPDFVLCDLSMLKTLPEREFRAGLAEVIKSGLIADPALFELFEHHDLAEFQINTGLLAEAVRRAVQVKADIVERDEKEKGDRKLLNLGHTFAHAVEKTSREFLHGEAVAIGMAMIADLSGQLGLLSDEDRTRIRNVISKMGLPLDSGIALPQLLNALKLDKKKNAESVSFILLNGIGRCEIRRFTFDEIDRITI